MDERKSAPMPSALETNGACINADGDHCGPMACPSPRSDCSNAFFFGKPQR